MSLTITKAGLLDTLQDLGRVGYRHLGINPTGAMDQYSLQVANLLVGNERDEACLELFFPAATLSFEEDALIAITGADMGATMSGENLPVNKPIWIRKGSLLHFDHLKEGYCSYLAARGGFDIPAWLGSQSTHLRAGAGGWEGRALKKGDQIRFRTTVQCPLDWNKNHHHTLPFGAAPLREALPSDLVFALRGPEWEELDDHSKELLSSSSFTITVPSDRMGFRLRGEHSLARKTDRELVSTAVDFGTIQLLPNGQMVVLLADHQTTGGYPRIAQVIKAHHHRLVQKRPGEQIRLKWVDYEESVRSCISQEQNLRHLQIACILKLEEHCTHEPFKNQRISKPDH